MLEIAKVVLSVFRAGFNIFTWRDPYLTFLFQLGSIIFVCILIVFPWRLFFFVVGLGLFGPQNFFVRMILEKKKAKQNESGATYIPQDTPREQVKKSFFSRAKGGQDRVRVSKASDFRFHNHLMTNGGIDLREDKQKSEGKVYRAVVPNSPFISRRFYDWPPNPSLSRADVYKDD